MATGLRTCRKAETSVLSMVHPGRPCLHCTLCKEKYPVYTHPIKWKNEHLYTLLRELEPNISIQPESCVCRNCRDDLLRIQHAGPTSKGARPPRWAQQDSDNNIAQSTCEIPDCSQLASTLTKLRPWAEICSILRIDAASGGDAHSTGTKLCSEHYRMLHMELNPTTYQRKCPACSRKIANRGYSRPCVEPQLFEAHLRENTDFTGNLTAEDRVCMGCYRYSLNISKLSKECPITSTDEDFNALIESIRKSLTLSPGSEIETIELAVKLTALDVAEELKANHAITLQKAFSSFKAHMEGQDKHRTPRWLLGHLSSCLKHHLAYFCTVRKHGIILYRQGRELQSLSHAVYMRGAGPTQGTGDLRAMCKDINTKIKRQIRTTSESLSTTTSFDIQQMIDSIDPDLWETICILTASEKRKRKRKPRPTTKKRRNRVSSTHVKNIRRLFILHQIMFSIDKTCSTPFHLLNADLLDCLGGSAELIRIFNRLGLCVSLDTLSRHIQTTISTVQKDSLLQGLDPSNITVFTVDNIDYLHSYAKVFCGNQKLSYHGTTIQAVQTKQLTRQVGRRRSHALLSPAMGDMKSPIPKRVRGRTGTEFSDACTQHGPIHLQTHCFKSSNMTPTEPNTLSEFQLSGTERASLDRVLLCATGYCSVKNVAAESESSFIGMQQFVAFADNITQAEVGHVKYVGVLDEVADTKDTVLHIISDLHTEYICRHEKSFVVIEGDAKVYDIIQSVKREYGSDLDWVIPFPGDWHLLKNYQICLMKPFFDAGLKELATVAGYPVLSIQNCSNFQRTHSFLLEAWESLFAHMLQCFLPTADHATQAALQATVLTHVSELKRYSNDRTATYCTLRSLYEQLGELKLMPAFHSYIEQMAKQDDNWTFWSRFVFRDCLAYIGLFLALRSENWPLRMASIKSLAANFTAFDHPTCQQLIARHILDVSNMPQSLIQYFEQGGFALSITGQALHSVGLDECHELLINRHVKRAVIRPTPDYINRITMYIPTRISGIEHLRQQIFGVQQTDNKSCIFSPSTDEAKSGQNVQAMASKIKTSTLLPSSPGENRGLANSFRGLVATEVQRHDLLSFYEIGKEHYEKRVKTHLLNVPSVLVPIRRKGLHTFSTTKKNR